MNLIDIGCIFVLFSRIMELSFKNISKQRTKNIFKEVVKSYPELTGHKITLEGRHLRLATMLAQPIIGFTNIFSKKKSFKIFMSIHVIQSKDVEVEELPDEILKGWFAHELGHLVDYLPYSNFQMLLFGLKYTLNSAFKKRAEYAADEEAVKHGFGKELIKMKRFLLNNDQIFEAYKTRLRKYYPSIDIIEEKMKNAS